MHVGCCRARLQAVTTRLQVRMVKKSDKPQDIICFYNQVYIPAMKEYLMEVVSKPTSGEGAAGSVAKTGQLLNLSFPEDEGQVDVTHDAKDGEALRSLLCMPITSEKGRLMGAVEIVNKISGGTDSGAARFSAQDQELLSAFCRQAVSAIEKCQMFNKLRSLLDSAKELGPSALPCPDSHCRTIFVGRERLRSWSLAFSRAATLTVAVDALGTAALRALTVSGRKSPTEACRKRKIGRSRSEPYAHT